MNRTPHSIVDLSVMDSFTEGDMAVEKELLGIFIWQSDINIGTLRDCCIAGHCSAWTEAAHMLKGGAAGIGAHVLHGLCEKAQLQEDVSAQMRTILFVQIDSAYTQVKNYLAEAQFI